MKFIPRVQETFFYTVSIKKGTLTVAGVTVTLGEGNLTFSEKKQYDYLLDRGHLDDVRDGDDIPMDVSFDFRWTEITGGDVVSAIKGAGSEVSSDADTCRPYACDLVFDYAPDCGSEAAGTITLPDFRQESLDFDVRGGKISCSGKCNATEAVHSVASA